MQTYISHSEAETESIGEKFAKDLPDGTVIAMYGDLGAGKTAFVRGMAKGMGLTCRVSSPTFTIVNEYIGERELIHFDMYRLESATSAGRTISAAAPCVQSNGAKRSRMRFSATRSSCVSKSSATAKERSPLRREMQNADTCT